MDYILITFAYRDRNYEYTDDLKVPAFLPAGELIELFGEIYRVTGGALHAEPKGIILDRAKTLAEQGILHGAKLTLG